jgi:hypothetical protein
MLPYDTQPGLAVKQHPTGPKSLWQAGDLWYIIYTIRLSLAAASNSRAAAVRSHTRERLRLQERFGHVLPFMRRLESGQ